MRYDRKKACSQNYYIIYLHPASGTDVYWEQLDVMQENSVLKLSNLYLTPSA